MSILSMAYIGLADDSPLAAQAMALSLHDAADVMGAATSADFHLPRLAGALSGYGRRWHEIFFEERSESSAFVFGRWKTSWARTQRIGAFNKHMLAPQLPRSSAGWTGALASAADNRASSAV